MTNWADWDSLDDGKYRDEAAVIADLLASDEDDPYRDAKFKVLSEQIKHHVAEEEKPGSGIFAKARAAGVDVEALGREPVRPAGMENLESLPQRFEVMDADVAAMKDYIARHAG